MDIAQFCASIFPLIVGMTTMQIVISAALTKAVPQSDTGKSTEFCFESAF